MKNAFLLAILVLIALSALVIAAPPKIVVPKEILVKSPGGFYIYTYQIRFMKYGTAKHEGGKISTEIPVVPVVNKDFWLVNDEYKIVKKVTTRRDGWCGDATGHIATTTPLIGATDSSKTQASGKVFYYWGMIKGDPIIVNTSKPKNMAPIDAPTKPNKDVQKPFRRM